jgi:hypothetical protein
MKLIIDFSKKRDKQRLFEHLKTLSGSVYVTLEREVRSTNLNKYYFAVVVKMICDYTGEDHNSVHLELKKRFLPVFFRDRYKKQEVIYGGGTANLTNKQFQEYIEKCCSFAIDFFGIYIPKPNEIIEP